MVSGRLVVVIVLLTVGAPVSVGAASPETPAGTSTRLQATQTGDNASAPQSLGQSISSMMQASLAQTAGSVENGMWAAAYANASNASEKRALVQRRASRLNRSLEELRAERAALQAGFRNGTINRTTYLVRLSRIVGRLASLSEGIEETIERGAAVGVNQSRLQELRSRARNLSGPAVSRLARNLTGGQGPGPAGLFDRGPPGQAGPPGQGNASNGPSENRGPADRGGNASNNSERARNGSSNGPDSAANRTGGGKETGNPGNASSGSDNAGGQAGSSGNSSSASDHAGGQAGSNGNSSAGNDSGSGSDRSGSLNRPAGQSGATQPDGTAVREAVDYSVTA
ncbi:MAG: hypothetical protein ABEH59_04860 [Halobacteriales archaeon]